jgi:hypothetical protein
MTIEELRAELRAILAAEEQSPPDWQKIEARCLRTIGCLATEAEPSYPHDVVYHFLDDPDVRQKSAQYGDGQRQRLREWLDGRNVRNGWKADISSRAGWPR